MLNDKSIITRSICQTISIDNNADSGPNVDDHHNGTQSMVIYLLENLLMLEPKRCHAMPWRAFALRFGWLAQKSHKKSKNKFLSKISFSIFPASAMQRDRRDYATTYESTFSFIFIKKPNKNVHTTIFAFYLFVISVSVFVSHPTTNVLSGFGIRGIN